MKHTDTTIHTTTPTTGATTGPLGAFSTASLVNVVKRDRYSRYDERLGIELQRELSARRMAERREVVS